MNDIINAEVINIVILTLLSGACIPLGGGIGTIHSFLPQWHTEELRHLLIAFGGGVLLGSVSEVLVPEGIASMNQSIWSVPILFAGGISFFLLEWQLGLRRHESPQLMGMLLDYIPEAIALGGLVALGSSTAILLAILIGLQNLPEGFNAYREIINYNGNRPKRTLLTMVALVPLGPISGLIGYYFLTGHDAILGGIMLFASGGILYLIFQDIAPQSRLEKHWFPPLGAVLGFCTAVFSNMIVTH